MGLEYESDACRICTKFSGHSVHSSIQYSFNVVLPEESNELEFAFDRFNNAFKGSKINITNEPFETSTADEYSDSR